MGVARVGADDEQIIAGTLEELSNVDMGRPLHSLVLVGKRMHELERDFVRDFAVNRDVFDTIWARDYAGTT